MLKKWLIVLAIPLAFQVVFLVVLFRSQAERAEAQERAIHTVEVIARAETIDRLLAEAANVVLREAILRGIAPGRLKDKQDQARDLLAKLEAVVEDNPKNRAIVADVAARVGRYLDGLDVTDRLARDGRRDAVEARLRDPGRHDTLDEIRAQMELFLEGERKLHLMRKDRLDRVVAGQEWTLIVGSVLTLLTVGVLVDTFSRGFLRRVGTLSDNARRLAAGEPLASPLEGNDEIVQLDRSFHAMARALAERDQENEMFIYSVSHDLRSPLVNLQGFSRELALTAEDVRAAVAPLEKPAEVGKRIDRLLGEDMTGAIHFIQTAVARLSAIIDSLLRLSRAGRVEYQMQMLDMDAIVHRVADALRGSQNEKRAAIVVVGDLPPAVGDPTAIEQVFGNLLSNAVKYLDPARPGEIEVGTTTGGGGDDGDVLTTYYVKDNGLGIPSAHQAKLFLAFQRLHPGVAQGEGIGLALVRRMVERHGGRIWVESEAGTGSTFFVSLPSRPASPGLNGVPIPAASTAGASN